MSKLRAYKFRLLPTSTQEVLLNKTFGCVRYFWNTQVSVFNSYDKENNPNISFKTSTELRNELVWMQEVSAAAIQQKEMDFKEFKKQFFSKTRKKAIDKPAFKKKNSRSSFRLPNQKFKLIGSRIHLERIGKVKFVKDRDIPKDGKLRSVTVSKNLSGQYFISVLVQQEIRPKTKTNGTIGIDVGIKEFAVQSNNVFISNPKYFRENQSKLRAAQKHLSRKKKGSNRGNKQRIKVARIHQKITNQRDYFLQSYSTRLVTDFDIIIIEDLVISNMIKNRKLSKAISDASWSSFFRMLEYKCDWYGKTLVKINRFEPSSKTCSDCGWVNKDLTLKDREFVCHDCGIKIDRDLNAALNIKRAGVNTLYNQSQSDNKTSLLANHVEAIKVMKNSFL